MNGINYQYFNTIYCTVDAKIDDCQGEGYTICTDLVIQDCADCTNLVVNNGLILCDCEDSWNCNLCANDRPYWNTVNYRDSLYFQFQQYDATNGNNPEIPGVAGWGTSAAFYTIHRCCDDSQISTDGSEVVKAFVGLYGQSDYKGNETFTNIQQIQFNVASIISQGFGNVDEDHCFYFKFQFGTEIFCSEPFKLNSCNNKTVLIEGVYPAGMTDCFGYYYGRPVWSVGDAFTFVNQYRVKGSFELQQIEVEKEVVTKRLSATSATTCEIWLLRTIGLPQAVTKLLTNIFAAKEIYFDDLLYQIEGGVEKNNETGSQWFLETNFKRCDCFPDYSCN